MKKALYLLLLSLLAPIALATALVLTALFIALYCALLPLILLGGAMKYGCVLVSKLGKFVFPEPKNQFHDDNHYKRIAVNLLIGLVILPLTAVPVAIVAVSMTPILFLSSFCYFTAQITKILAEKVMKNPFDDKNGSAVDSSYQRMSTLNSSKESSCKSRFQQLKDFSHTRLFSKPKESQTPDMNMELTGSVNSISF